MPTAVVGGSARVVHTQRRLTATVRNAAGDVLTGKTITWASADPAIASVDATGLVTALAVGTTTIAATCEAVTSPVCTVRVYRELITGQLGLSLTATLDSAITTEQRTVTVTAVLEASGNPEPTYAAGTDTLLLEDSFEYASVSALNAEPEWLCERDQYASLVTGRGGTGTALRASYTATGYPNGPLLTWFVPGDPQLVYATWWFRVTAGTDLTQGGTGNNGFPSEGPKHFEAWRTVGARLTAGVGGVNLVNAQGGAKVGQEFHLRDNAMVAALGSEISFHQDVKTPRFDDINDGQWHRITYMLDNGDGMTSYAIWLDGVCIRTPTPRYATAAGGWSELRWFDIIPDGLVPGEEAWEFDWDIDDMQIWRP